MFLKDGDGYNKGTDGGATQYCTPFNVHDLKEMGMKQMQLRHCIEKSQDWKVFLKSKLEVDYYL